MEFEKGPLGRINRILTAAAVIMLAIWLWKWFGPDGGTIRRESGRAFLSYRGLFSLGVAVTSAGYLLWRFLDWLFWRKHFR